jgi:hypothetical protein
MVDLRKLTTYHRMMIMLCDIHHSMARPELRGESDRRRAPISDDLVIEALHPVSILQIGVPWQLLGGDNAAVAVRSVRSLDEAVGAIAQHRFDAIVLGSGLMDAWPTAAYERIAELAGSTPVLVQTEFVAPMSGIKQQQDREDDIIVANAKPSLLGRLVLAAILRSRALADAPETQIG